MSESIVCPTVQDPTVSATLRRGMTPNGEAFAIVQYRFFNARWIRYFLSASLSSSMVLMVSSPAVSGFTLVSILATVPFLAM